MIDGCPDGWVGTGIPVCVLGSGTAQQEPNSPRASRDGSLMKERDYIGLGLANQEEGPHLQNASIQSAQEKMECDNVELSLGLGLPEKAPPQSARVEQFASTGFQSDHFEAQIKSKHASPGAKSQHFWHHSFRVNLSSSDQLQNSNFQAETGSSANVLKNYASNTQSWGVASGRLAVPVPKISSIPAKRPFAEAVDHERRLSPPTPNHVASVEVSMPCAASASAGMYVWNGEPSTGSSVAGMGWQQARVGMEQGSNHSMGGMVGSSLVHPRQLSALPPHFQALQAGVGAPSPSIIKPCMAPNGAGVSLQAAGALKAEMENENNTSNAPVVGWPPVRTYRKNTLQAAQSNRTSSEDLHTKTAAGPSGGMEGGGHLNGNNSKNALFVKAKLDGVRICRKVDLKAYNSFEGLKSALQDMFQGFVSDNAKLDLLHGSNYVVTHEDKDGECWFVGDGPWSMFVESSVRSLRIMKSMDATSIGDKAAKLRAQASGKP